MILKIGQNIMFQKLFFTFEVNNTNRFNFFPLKTMGLSVHSSWAGSWARTMQRVAGTQNHEEEHLDGEERALGWVQSHTQWVTPEMVI